MTFREPGHSWVRFDEREFSDEPAFVGLAEAAERMNLTKAEVMRLVKVRALRATVMPDGEPLVEPAILM